MADNQTIDVVIVEDRLDEVNRICLWLGLNSVNTEVNLVSDPDNVAAERISGEESPAIFIEPPREEKQADAMWQTLKKSIREYNPRVVVFDYLLGGSKGDQPNGIAFGIRCKEAWPDLGVVIVTTGGDGALEGIIKSQEELDEQRARFDWPVNDAWVKPWGPAGKNVAGHIIQTSIPYRDRVAKLINNASRPSEH